MEAKELRDIKTDDGWGIDRREDESATVSIQPAYKVFIRDENTGYFFLVRGTATNRAGRSPLLSNLP